MTQHTFTTRISKTDFEITYTAEANALGLLSIKVKGVDIQAAGQLARDIKKEVKLHHEINYQKNINL